MAERTVEAGFFGSAGHGDPEFVFSDKTFSVSWDFSKTPVGKNKTIPILQIPKGFCIDRISVIQTKATNAAATLTFGLKSDNAKLVGGNFALGTAALLRSSQAGVTGADVGDTTLFVDDDDVICMVVPAELTDGAFSLFIHGFSAFGEGPTVNKTGNEVYRQTLQVEDNVAGPRPSFD
jgi:hypothetical protein